MTTPSHPPRLTWPQRAAGGLRFKLRAWGVAQAAPVGRVLWALARLERGRRALRRGGSSSPQGEQGGDGSGLRAPGAPRRALDPADRARAAARMAQVLGALRGPFAKLGQFASLRVDLLEPEVRAAFASLRQHLPPLPAPWIREVVEQELGAPLEARFARFETRPLGAASIAQAHRASLPDGTPVVVKVQYPWLAASLPADLRWLRGLLRRGGGEALLARGIFDEFAAGVAEELDFRREARVAAEIAANLADEPSVVVPRVVASHSSSRVLTVAWQPTLPLEDRLALAARGVEPARVLEIVGRAYARMVFADGLFHADPHPGNLFVLDESGAADDPRVLFVDFGLSKRLDPELRRELRRGILALLEGELEAFLAGMQRLDMIAPGAEGAVREAVGAMFARLRGEGSAPLAMDGRRLRALEQEAKRLLLETPGLVLPTELLLYARTVSYLFSLAAELAPQVDMLRLCMPHLLRFLAEREPPEQAAATSATQAAPRASGAPR